MNASPRPPAPPERELKTKAYSKEGLARSGGDDPRDEMREWIHDSTDRLQADVDIWEAEIEEELSKTKKQQNMARINHLETSVTRHKDHVVRLEQCLRCLENEDISTEQVWINPDA